MTTTRGVPGAVIWSHLPGFAPPPTPSPRWEGTPASQGRRTDRPRSGRGDGGRCRPWRPRKRGCGGRARRGAPGRRCTAPSPSPPRSGPARQAPVSARRHPAGSRSVGEILRRQIDMPHRRSVLHDVAKDVGHLQGDAEGVGEPFGLGVPGPIGPCRQTEHAEARAARSTRRPGGSRAPARRRSDISFRRSPSRISNT